MKSLKIPAKYTRALGKASLKIKAKSPELLMVAGIGGVIASAVIACKQTLKANDILVESAENLDAIHKVAEDPEKADVYTEEDRRKDVMVNAVQTGVKLAKVYAPAIILGGASIACIVKSHNILKARNIALASAYKAVSDGFKRYRKNVIEEYGEEVDHNMRYSIKAREIDEPVFDEHNNIIGTEKKTVKVTEAPKNDEFIFFFDSSSDVWTDDAEMNKRKLLGRQRIWNSILSTRGYVFLNEILADLDIPITKAGQKVGWVYENVGDNIDFGITCVNREATRRFINGYEPVVLLDFNVDGDILDRIDWSKR